MDTAKRSSSFERHLTVVLGLTVPLIVAFGIVFAVNTFKSEGSSGTPRTYDSARDPLAGAQVIQPRSLKWLSRKMTKERMFGIAVGSCSACSVNKLNRSQLAALSARPLVAIIEGTEELGAKAIADYAGFDAYVQLTASEYRALNPAWTHRAYWLDASGRISKCQPWAAPLEEFNRS